MANIPSAPTKFEEWQDRPWGYDLVMLQGTTSTLCAHLLTGKNAKSLSDAKFETQVGPYRVVAGTHVGERAGDNEDCVTIDLLHPSVSVVDGYGPDGREVSHILGRNLTRPTVQEGINLAVTEMKLQNVSEHSGACMVRAELPGGAVPLAHRGDCRGIVADDKGNELYVTKDETLLQQLVDMGVWDADLLHYHQYRHVVAQAITPTMSVKAAHTSPPVPVLPGYRLLLMSDGNGDNLTPKELLDLIRGKTALEAYFIIADVVSRRAQNADAIIQQTPDREKDGKYADGYLSKPKQDNQALVVVDIG